jgi:hypothetical protein
VVPLLLDLLLTKVWHQTRAVIRQLISAKKGKDSKAQTKCHAKSEVVIPKTLKKFFE